jgi:hypothetical protein
MYNNVFPLVVHCRKQLYHAYIPFLSIASCAELILCMLHATHVRL